MKRVYTVFSLLLVACLVSGQYDPKENFYDAEFFFAEEDYAEALYSYTQVYKDGFQDNANVNYRIGQCLLNIDKRKTEAIPYLEKAVQNINPKYKEGSFKETMAPSDALLYLGNAYRIDYQVENAIESYQKFLESDNQVAAQISYVKLQLDACKNLKETVPNERVDFEIGALGQINEIRAPLYNPAVSGDLNTLAFMGQHKFYNGVYVAKKEGGKWLRAKNITPSIQSDGNQTVLSLSHDGSKILVSWSDNYDSEIWVTEWANGRWNVSKPVGKPINSKYYESHACFSPDEKSIYFSSNRRESLGGMDIFRCDRNPDGTWSEVVLLGENINTALNEDNPSVSPDGKRLYFSSQGHPNCLGGFDVYYCNIMEDGSLSKPVNLGYPLNTSDDDLAYTPKEIDYNGYLTIYAKGEESQTELFRFEYIPEGTSSVAMAFERIRDERPKEELVVSEPVAQLTETIENIETTEVVEATEATEVVEATEVTEVVEATEVVEVVETYLIKPIFFDFDSQALNETAHKKLDDLSLILTKFPNLSLQISAHTDAVGNMQYNEALSERRAKSVSKYLEGKGIDTNRLEIKAVGETDHIAINRTADNHDAPKGRALNRRVQFKVKMAGDILVEVEEIKVPDHLKIN